MTAILRREPRPRSQCYYLPECLPMPAAKSVYFLYEYFYILIQELLVYFKIYTHRVLRTRRATRHLDSFFFFPQKTIACGGAIEKKTFLNFFFFFEVNIV